MKEDNVWRPNWFVRKPGETTNGVQIGCLVKISSDASFWNGKKVERWYYLKKWYVTGLDGNRATLGRDESGKYKITVPISTNYLTVLEGAKDDERETDIHSQKL